MQELMHHRQRLRSVGAAAHVINISAANDGSIAASRYYNREYETRERISMTDSGGLNAGASPSEPPLPSRPESSRTKSPYRRDYSRSQHHEQQQQQQLQPSEGLEREELVTTQSEIGLSWDNVGTFEKPLPAQPKAQSVVNVGRSTNSGLNVKDLANRFNSRSGNKSSFRPSWAKNTNANANTRPMNAVNTNLSGSKIDTQMEEPESLQKERKEKNIKSKESNCKTVPEGKNGKESGGFESEKVQKGDGRGTNNKAHFWRSQPTQGTSRPSKRGSTSDTNHADNYEATHTGSSSPPGLNNRSSRRVSVSPRRVRLRGYKSDLKEQGRDQGGSRIDRSNDINAEEKESKQGASVSPTQEEVPHRSDLRADLKPNDGKVEEVGHAEKNTKETDARHVSPRAQRLLKTRNESNFRKKSKSPSRRLGSDSPSKGRRRMQAQNFQSRIAQFSKGAQNSKSDLRRQSKDQVENKGENGKPEKTSTNLPGENVGFEGQRNKSHFWKDQLQNKNREKESNDYRAATSPISNSDLGWQKNEERQIANPNCEKNEAEFDKIPRKCNQISPKQSNGGQNEVNQHRARPSERLPERQHAKGKGNNFWISQQNKSEHPSATGHSQPFLKQNLELQNLSKTNLSSPPRQPVDVSSNSSSPSQSPTVKVSLAKLELVQSEDKTTPHNLSTSSGDYKNQYMQYMLRNRRNKSTPDLSFMSNDDSTELATEQKEEFRRSLVKVMPVSEGKETKAQHVDSLSGQVEEENGTTEKDFVPMENELSDSTRESRQYKVNNRPQAWKSISRDQLEKKDGSVVQTYHDQTHFTRRKVFENSGKLEIDAIEEKSRISTDDETARNRKYVERSEDKNDSNVERDDSYHQRLSKLQQYNRAVKTQTVSPPTPSKSMDLSRKADSSNLIVTPSRSTATTVTTTDESQNITAPWSSPQRQKAASSFQTPNSPVQEGSSNYHHEHDTSTVITDTSSFLPVSEVKKKLWDDGEHLKQWHKDGLPQPIRPKCAEEDAQASIFKSRYYRAAEVAQKNCAEHNTAPVQADKIYHNRRETNHANKGKTTPSPTGSIGEGGNRHITTNDAPISTAKDTSVEKLLAKLSSVERDDPNTALEVIDTIIENERNSIDQAPEKISETLNDTNEFPSGSIESFEVNEDLMSMDSGSSEYDSDDSTVSSITNPTYMSGFGDSFSFSRRQQFSKLVARDGRLSPPYQSTRPSSFLADKNGHPRSAELPPRQPHRAQRNMKSHNGRQAVTNIKKTKNSATYSARSTIDGGTKKKLPNKAIQSSAGGLTARTKPKPFGAKGSSMNNQGLLNKLKDWDEESDGIEEIDTYEIEENDPGSPNTSSERLKRLANKIHNGENFPGPSKKYSQKYFNGKEERRFLYPKAPKPVSKTKSGESKREIDSWEPSSTEFFDDNFFKKDSREIDTLNDENNVFDAFNQSTHMRSNDVFSRQALDRKFSHVEKAYQNSIPF